MRLFNLLIIGGLATASSILAQSNNTTDLLGVALREVCTTTNENGSLTNQVFDNARLIQQCAAEVGVTNLGDLSLVYNRTNPALQILSGTNQSILCTAMSFAPRMSMTNNHNTKIEVLSFIFLGTNTMSSGTVCTVETSAAQTNTPFPSLNLIGRFQYSIDANGTNRAAICHGVFLAMPGLTVEKDGDADTDAKTDGEENEHSNDGLDDSSA
jgi:hypothetical protein